MKKVLALVLTSALAVGAMAVSASATSSNGVSDQVLVNPSNTYSGTKVGGQSNLAVSGGLTFTGANGGVTHAELAGTNVYINKAGSFVTYVTIDHTLGEVPLPGTGFHYNYKDLNFAGPSKETTSYTIEYSDTDGAHTGTPQGVNGEDLLKVRVSWDGDLKSYIVTMNVVDNPTVEIFENVTVTFKVATTLGNLLGSNASSTYYTETNKGINNYYNNPVYMTINPYASTYTGTNSYNDYAENVGGFTLMNQRYTRKDVYTDASGDYRINAATEYPVVDATAFDAAYGKKLIISYPGYTVTFDKIKNQTVSLNLEADIDRAPTVKLDSNTPILTATFHDIYVQDDVKVSFTIGADAQNYKGRELYAYYLNAEDKPITGTEVKVTVSDDSKTLVLEVKAGSRLAAYGEDVASATLGIYGSQQETVAGDAGTVNNGTGSSTSKNPSTGASDVINVAAAFAAVSLAAAGFVAVNKASK